MLKVILNQLLCLMFLLVSNNVTLAQSRVFTYNLTTNSRDEIYLDVENKVYFNVCGENMDDLEILSNYFSIKRDNYCYFNIINKIGTNCNYMFFISKKGKIIDSVQFLYKPIPLPRVFVYDIEIGHFTSYYLREFGIKPVIINKKKFEYTLVDYDLILKNQKTDSIYYQVKKTDCSYTEEDRNAMYPMRKNDKIILKNIRLKGPYNEIFQMPDLIYTIR